jgi:long-subunit acyl-CoA synthetase (AMP-forming)
MAAGGQVMVVRSATQGQAGYLEECGEGERGYLVMRGDNLMSGYVQGQAATDK